jgi:circadian clock protein KaiB
LEVVDFLREPQRALADGVIVTPTLVRLAPLPMRKVIGTLRDTLTVLAALGLPEARHV